MSYTLPPLGGIDLSGDSGAYTLPPLNSIDLSGGGAPASGPTGSISASLDFLASFSGLLIPAGAISAALQFTANFVGGGGAWGPWSADLGFSSEFSGKTSDVFGGVSSGIGLSFSGKGFQDWASIISPIQLQEIYTLTVTGGADSLDDIVIPISSWQATSRASPRQSYVQAVVPAARQYLEALEARVNGDLVISQGFKFDDGSVKTEEIVRARFDTSRYDEGAARFTVTLSGYSPGAELQTGYRMLQGVRSVSLTSGKYRVRCKADLFLRPGMIANTGGVSFPVSYINYYANGTDRFCEVSDE